MAFYNLLKEIKLELAIDVYIIYSNKSVFLFFI